MVTSPTELRKQLIERKEELSRRRAALNEKKRVAESMKKHEQTSMLDSRTQREASAHEEVVKTYTTKELLMLRNDELSRRSVEHSKRERHEKLLWRSPTTQQGGSMGTDERSGEYPRSASLVGQSNDLGPDHMNTSTKEYAFVKGVTSPPIKDDTYARLMNCGSGRTVLRHQIQRRNQELLQNQTQPEGSSGEYDFAASCSLTGARPKVAAHGGSSTSRQLDLFSMSPVTIAPSCSSPVRHGAAAAFTPDGRSPAPAYPSPNSNQARGGGVGLGGSGRIRIRTPAIAEGVADTFVLQHSMLSHSGSGVRWK